jgi:hypothetical protein
MTRSNKEDGRGMWSIWKIREKHALKMSVTVKI